MDDKKICVLGSSGFVGQNLMNYLKNSFSVNLRSEDWHDKLLEGKPEVIVNLIGKAHDHVGTASEQEYYHANVEILQSVFNCFVKSPARLFIHISSIAAVEEYESTSAINEQTLCRPQSFYGKTKREGELWLLSQSLPPDKSIVILRPPMIHGPGDKGNLGLLFKFVEMGFPYPLANVVNQRSLLSIDNFNFLVGEIVLNYNNLRSRLYNLSDDGSISTLDIIKLIGEVHNKKLKLIKVPLSLVKFGVKVAEMFGLPLNTRKFRKLTGTLLVSNEKIKGDLGIGMLPISIEYGLKKTVSSFIK